NLHIVFLESRPQIGQSRSTRQHQLLRCLPPLFVQAVAELANKVLQVLPVLIAQRSLANEGRQSGRVARHAVGLEKGLICLDIVLSHRFPAYQPLRGPPTNQSLVVPEKRPHSSPQFRASYSSQSIRGGRAPQGHFILESCQQQRVRLALLPAQACQACKNVVL